jgi:hypothetical protein
LDVTNNIIIAGKENINNAKNTAPYLNLNGSAIDDITNGKVKYLLELTISNGSKKLFHDWNGNPF